MPKNKPAKESAHHIEHTSVAPYESNPFTLSFNALSKFFNANSNWAIAIIILGIFGFIAQILRAILETVRDSSSHSTGSSALSNSSPLSPSLVIAIIIVVVVVVIFAVVISTVINTFLQGMFSYVALKSNQGINVTFKEAFNQTLRRFWRLFGANLLATLKIVGWSFLLIVPGIIAGLRYSLLSYVIMDEDQEHGGIGQSHQRVKSLVSDRLLEVLGIATVAAIIPIVGGLLSIAGKGSLYRQLQVYSDGNLQKPKIHWLNYLGLILIGVLFAFIIIATIFIIVFVSFVSK